MRSGIAVLAAGIGGVWISELAVGAAERVAVLSAGGRGSRIAVLVAGVKGSGIAVLTAGVGGSGLKVGKRIGLLYMYLQIVWEWPRIAVLAAGGKGMGLLYL